MSVLFYRKRDLCTLKSNKDKKNESLKHLKKTGAGDWQKAIL